MPRSVSWSSLALLPLALALACGAPEARPDVGPVASAFEAHAARQAVPRDLLVAIARVEGGLDMPRTREIDVDNEVPAAGPMQLRRGKLDTLALGAALSGRSELDLRRDSDAALDAGARVLAEIGRRTGARPGDLTSWTRAVEELSGYADDTRRAEYTHRVFAVLSHGGTFDARDGERIVLPAHDIPIELTVDLRGTLRLAANTPEFPGAEWITTSCDGKCNLTRTGAIEYVVVHDTEGGWDASVATLQNDPGKSVQYIIGTDGRTAQFLAESVNAWHAGNSYYNNRSVGIEHVGYSTKPYPDAQYAKSAEMLKYLTDKYKIAKDRAHVIGHDQIPNGNKIAQSSPACALSPKDCESSPNYGGASRHTDPGVWEWCSYMPRFGGACKCNDAGATLTCSQDRKSAFRCAGDKLDYRVCDAPCQPGTGKADAVCNAIVPPPPPVTPPDPAPPTQAPAPVGQPPPADEAPIPPATESGCSLASPPRGADLAGPGLLLIPALVAARAGRRRRARAHDPASA
jgi:N-acetyl-anhydromuramyl-L-alanine amidase AmpD